MIKWLVPFSLNIKNSKVDILALTTTEQAKHNKQTMSGTRQSRALYLRR
jgi:hypothetical protein